MSTSAVANHTTALPLRRGGAGEGTRRRGEGRGALVGGHVLLLLASERQAGLGEREGGRAPSEQLSAAGGAREGALKQNKA